MACSTLKGKLSISTISTSPRRLALLLLCFLPEELTSYISHPFHKTLSGLFGSFVSALLFFGLQTDIWLLASGKKREELYSTQRCSIWYWSGNRRRKKRDSRRVTTKELPIRSRNYTRYTLRQSKSLTVCHQLPLPLALQLVCAAPKLHALDSAHIFPLLSSLQRASSLPVHYYINVVRSTSP